MSMEIIKRTSKLLKDSYAMLDSCSFDASKLQHFLKKMGTAACEG
jgi:hypothetical protein